MKIAAALTDKTDRHANNQIWHVYILSCCDGTLYTGIATDLDRRVAEHNSIKGGARYTRPRRPVRLVYAEKAESRSAATRREYCIKKMNKAGKLDLIAGFVVCAEKEGPSQSPTEQDQPFDQAIATSSI